MCSRLDGPNGLILQRDCRLIRVREIRIYREELFQSVTGRCKYSDGKGRSCQGVYHRDNDNSLHFGTGTKLIVTDVKPQSPILRLFQPDRKDLEEESKFFVACLVTNFFPEVIKVNWEVPEIQSRKILTEPVKKMSKGNYSLISRMEISKNEWNQETITCRVEHETGSNKVSTNSESRSANSENNGHEAATCPSAEEELQKSTDEETSSTSLRVAIVTYTALLTKSVLYCCIISFVVYKMDYRGTKKST
ncbi:immunoglobulin gamma-1 heavy chain-like [Mobula birostris]|uniref:immunoglobulin gamma-1 heavy chain-like n=1 Tax=Mobula birostris TaxID=1983395 RepID=UPI003B28B435